MSWIVDVDEGCQDDIKRACFKNRGLEEALRKKVKRLAGNPLLGKPLRANLKNTFRVHVLRSFVLIYDVDRDRKVVRLLKFAHHDKAYRV